MSTPRTNVQATTPKPTKFSFSEAVAGYSMSAAQRAAAIESGEDENRSLLSEEDEEEDGLENKTSTSTKL